MCCLFVLCRMSVCLFQHDIVSICWLVVIFFLSLFPSLRLDLDKWIYDPPSESEDEFKSDLTFMLTSGGNDHSPTMNSYSSHQGKKGKKRRGKKGEAEEDEDEELEKVRGFPPYFSPLITCSHLHCSAESSGGWTS